MQVDGDQILESTQEAMKPAPNNGRIKEISATNGIILLWRRNSKNRFSTRCYVKILGAKERGKIEFLPLRSRRHFLIQLSFSFFKELK